MDLRNKKVLVTGGDGFIGSHLVEALVAQGAIVTALAQYNSFNHWGWLEDTKVLDRVQVETGDIRDAHFCLHITKDQDVVFHLAALIPIPYSYKAPDSYVDTNIKGTLYMCQAARANGVKKFIHTSTSEVYGSAQFVPITEDHPLQAQSPYSATKIGADAIAISFHNAFDFPVYVARPFNTYGPRQSARAILPATIAQIAAGKKEIELGDMTPTRDFTFVTDTCAGFIAIAGLETGAGEVFQIGTNTEISMGEAVEQIIELMGGGVKVVQKQERIRPGKSEVMRLKCDYGKLHKASGYAPQVTFKDGIQRTIEWIRQRPTAYKADIYNV